MNFSVLTSASDIQALIRWHNDCSTYVVLDTETDNKNPRLANLIDIQMSSRGEDEAVMFSGSFLPLLADLKPTQVYHNFKYDWKVMLRHGLDMRGRPVRDTMLLHHLVDESAPHDLDSIVQTKWGDFYKADFWKKYGSYLEAPEQERMVYALKDIYYTKKIYEWLKTELQAFGLW